MSEEKKHSASQSNKKQSSRHHHSAMDYIRIPVLFVLIACIAVVPAGLILLRVTENAVHSAQETLIMTYSDILPQSASFKPSSTTGGAVSISEPRVAEKIGELSCPTAGLHTDVYYVINRVSLRNGAAMSKKNGFPGQGERITVNGNAATAFKALYNVQVDDVITLQTTWGVYRYRVVSTDVANAEDIYTLGETLVLATAKSQKAFAYYNEEKLYVVAELIEGPTVTEVKA